MHWLCHSQITNQLLAGILYNLPNTSTLANSAVPCLMYGSKQSKSEQRWNIFRTAAEGCSRQRCCLQIGSMLPTDKFQPTFGLSVHGGLQANSMALKSINVIFCPSNLKGERRAPLINSDKRSFHCYALLHNMSTTTSLCLHRVIRLLKVIDLVLMYISILCNNQVLLLMTLWNLKPSEWIRDTFISGLPSGTFRRVIPERSGG